MESWRRKKEKGKAGKCFLKNGSMFLEKLIADCNGISNPIRMFSSDQISEATSKYDLGEYRDIYFPWYKGDIEGRPYAIKRDAEQLYEEEEEEEMVYNDIVLSARVSNHSGFPKLIGCCLEFTCPVLVFEDLDYIVLNQRGSVGCLIDPLLPWNVRLKIAKEVATAITYLHTAFPRIIIHRDIKASNVFLDKNWTAKLTGLSCAVTLPEGKSWLEVPVVGTVGYLDPEYYRTSLVTEYTDVFSFGALMLVLLMGRPAIFDASNSVHRNIVEYVKDLQERGEPVVFQGERYEHVQMRMFLDLALRCCEEKIEDRPKMIMVAKEIKLIEQGLYVSEMLENVSGDSQISDQIMFLHQLNANCLDIINTVRMFSSDQIFMATSHFDPISSIVEDIDTNFTWYNGGILGRPYVIKRYTNRLYAEQEMTYNDITLSARVSNHSGFLKLMGCCLEFLLPVLVFEDLDYRVLNKRGTVGCEDAPLLPWNVRLKIAKEIADAITYLHTAFPRIIIHRNIRAENVFLDKNGTAKLTDFSLAVTLPEGKSWIEEPLVGTYGYPDPTYFSTSLLTEYSDVFSFGILMLILLMGRPAYLQGSDGRSYFNILEYVKDLQERGEPVVFGGDSNDMKPDQMKMFLELALRCCEKRNEDRPKMIMVAKEIELIVKGSFDSEMLENVFEDGQV